MTAGELYAIVKDLPQEAKPRRIVGFARGCWFILQTAETGDKPVCVDSFLFPEEAALMFEASMMRWLIGEGYHKFNYVLYDHEVVLECYDKTVRTPLECGSKIQTTTILLAAMCKAVAA